jgi:hypothetical protein
MSPALLSPDVRTAEEGSVYQKNEGVKGNCGLPMVLQLRLSGIS